MTSTTLYDLFDDEVFEVIEVQRGRIGRISDELSIKDSNLTVYKHVDIDRLKVLIVVPFYNSEQRTNSLYQSKGIYYMPVVNISCPDPELETRLYRFFLPIAMIILSKLIQYLRSNRKSIVMAGHGADVDALLINDLKYNNCVGIRSYTKVYNLDEKEDMLKRINEKLVSIGLAAID